MKMAKDILYLELNIRVQNIYVRLKINIDSHFWKTLAKSSRGFSRLTPSTQKMGHKPDCGRTFG